ncbi:MAG: aspartate-semialdehyde dehydrogenase, partial [Clostridia bacterium]|nr:aspartate-semialdehyde dehydrogenase [Clostridia bacterium]
MSWKEQLQKSIRTAPELAELLDLTPEEEARYTDLLKRYPMMITPYYLSLADLSDPDDPIRKMCIPSFDEFNPDGSPDTSGEASNTVLKGLQHKYKSTALMLSTNRCAMYCRHCFRKRLVGLSEDELSKRVDEAVKYLKEHKEVSNLLISGGDAFMNSNKIIERYLHDLTEIDHLDFIRFGSRIPVTLPERIYGDKEFLDLFEHYADKKAIYLVTQFNHPRELTEDAFKGLGVDIALFSAGGGTSKVFAPIVANSGAVVIDNSSTWRMDPDVPLVVPEVNAHAISQYTKKGIIANPNCSTIQAMVPLKPLATKYGLKRVIYSTYQAVSGAGMGGYGDLEAGLKGEATKKFPYPIAGNVLPQIDVFLENGYTKEEQKMIEESRKILELPSLRVT